MTARPKLLTTADLAARLGRSQHEIRRLCAVPGRVPGAVKIGGNWLVPESAGLARIVVPRRKAGKP